MTQPKVNALLLITIVVMSVCPIIAALYFTDNALTTSLNLGFNTQIVDTLDRSAHDLKALGRLDPAHNAEYRAEFERVEALKAIYSSPELLKKSVRHSLLIYFALGVLMALLLATVAASLLSRKISRSFGVTFTELAKNQERVRYLEEMSSWQELAKMLAHEIKNPLTPIEVLVTSLSKAYLAKPQEEFRAQLSQTQTMINEELLHLKNTVNKFSEFARLPAVHLTAVNLSDTLRQNVSSLKTAHDAVSIQLSGLDVLPELRVNLDATLFRQVLTNIIRNGIEANPERKVEFTIDVMLEDDAVRVAIRNDGEAVPAALVGRIFDPYVSGKSSKDNMGLGLAIVRKIIIEHGGDIVYNEENGQPVFMITLPKLT